MPFFNRSMASSARESTGSGNEPSSSSRTTRTMPGSTHKGTDIYKEADPAIAQKYKQQMSKRKLLFLQSLLKAQVTQLNESVSTLAVETNGPLFKTYQIKKDKIRHKGEHVIIYDAKCPLSSSTSVRVYAKNVIDPSTSVFLKILRHLGRKHPFLVHTYELFHDKVSVYVFQEWCNKGNLAEYMEKREVLSEREAAVWAKQIYRALDFLGDQAIAHRDLSPTHLVIQPQSGNEVWCKLTGFTQSIIYWDSAVNDIAYCQCWPASRQAADGANFQPPEVYGDSEKEQFDPLMADAWSFGANIYYMVFKTYPYNVVEPYDNIDEEIWANIVKGSISEDCKNFIYALTRANANDRMPFGDFVENHPWIKANSIMINQNNKASGSVTGSSMGSGSKSKGSKVSGSMASSSKAGGSVTSSKMAGSSKSGTSKMGGSVTSSSKAGGSVSGPNLASSSKTAGSVSDGSSAGGSNLFGEKSVFDSKNMSANSSSSSDSLD